MTPDQLLAQLDDAVSALDQPTMDGLNTYFVSRAAHQAGLKVALSGLGSDEIFGGYSTFMTVPRAESVAGLGRWVPGPLRRLTAGMAVRIASGDAVRKAAAAWRSPRDFPHSYYFTRLLFTPSRVRRLLSPYFEDREEGRAEISVWRKRMQDTAREAARLDSFTSVSCFELQSYMLNTLLRDTDTVSMANSLEVRVPFLDHRLVEFVARLPKAAKCRSGVPKASAGRVIVRPAAGRCCGPVQADVHISLGRVAQRSAGRASVTGFGESHARAAKIYEPASCPWRLAKLRHRSYQLVTSLEPLCAQRVGAASPRWRGHGKGIRCDGRPPRCHCERSSEFTVLKQGESVPDAHTWN